MAGRRVGPSTEAARWRALAACSLSVDAGADWDALLAVLPATGVGRSGGWTIILREPVRAFMVSDVHRRTCVGVSIL